MKVTLEKGFEPTKLTLPEASKEVGLQAHELRSIYFKHPVAFKGVIFQQWNDLNTAYTLMVYRGDLDRLKAVLEKVAPSPVIEKKVSYNYVELARLTGKRPGAITSLKFNKPSLFVFSHRGGKKNHEVFYTAETLERIQKFLAKGKNSPKTKAKQPVKPAFTPPPINHDAVAMLLIKNGFEEAGLWLIKHA